MTDAPKFTDAQQRAVVAGERDLWVTAGAGSGKTRVLTERYLHLHLVREVPIQRILAITFTERAAREMRERIAERLRAEGSVDALHELPHAPIGTIDGFCYRTIQEYADAAGVDPSIRVADQVEANGVAEEVWGRTVAHWWTKFPDEMEFLLRSFGWAYGDRFAAGIDPQPAMELVRQIRTAGRSVESTSFDVDLAPLERSVDEGIERAIEGARLALTHDPAPKTAEKLTSITSLERRKTATRAVRERLVQEVRDAVDLRVSKAAKEVMAEAIAALDEAILLHEEMKIHPARATFGKLLGELAGAYADEKRRRGVVDFLDLEELTASLMKRKEIRREVRKRYRFLLLDECQDTNELQLAIVRGLQNEGCFLAVGDAKQSIYRFRDADVGAFIDLGETMSPSTERINLDINFRSRRGILQFVNELFPLLWAGNEAMRVPYEPLAPPEEAGEDGEDPAVEIIKVTGATTGEARKAEAREIAAAIREITSREGEPFDFSDVAVLFRSSSDMGVYEKELRRAGIPVVVASGRGFFQTREVTDLLVALQAVDDPLDNTVLASFLRSPLCAVSDETLHELLADRDEREVTLWERICGLPESAPSMESILTARTLLTSARSMRGMVPLSTLLRILIESTGYLDSISIKPGGVRRRANVGKLIALAAELDSRGERSLSESIVTLSRFRTTRLREPESAVDEERNAVRFLTVHGAKGMEFPVVILADMGRRSGAKPSPILFHKQLGIGFRPSGSKPYLFTKISEENSAAEAAEEMRLLYVAATRAESKLILSGGDTGRPHGWLRAIGDTGVPLQGEGIVEWRGVNIRVRPPETIGESRAVPGGVEQWQVGDGLPSLEGHAASRSLAERMTAEGLRPALDPRGRSVSAVERFVGCQREWWLSRTMPFPPPPKIPVAGQSEGGVSLGNEFHRLMESAWGVANSTSDSDSPELILWRDRFLASPAGRSAADARELHTERSFAAVVGGRPLRGTIDLLYRDLDGWHIVDYKTDSSPPERLLEKYSLSMALYRLGVRAAAGNSEEPVSASIYAARATELIPVPPEADHEAIAVLESYDEGEKTGNVPASPSGRCDHCSYRHGCPAISLDGQNDRVEPKFQTE